MTAGRVPSLVGGVLTAGLIAFTPLTWQAILTWISCIAIVGGGALLILKVINAVVAGKAARALRRSISGGYDAAMSQTPKGAREVGTFVRYADYLTRSGRVDAAIPMYRQAVQHLDAPRRIRGLSASHLGWILLGRYADDPVTDEVRRLLVIATDEQPRHWQTMRLAAYVFAYDGDSAASLRAVRSARKRGPNDPGLRSQLLCIEAIAHAALGQTAVAARMRGEATRLWPEIDLVSEVDTAISNAGHR